MEKVIYKISNKINDKIYIGSTHNFKLRYNQHKYHLLKNTHHSNILQNFVNKYGFDSLVFEIIEIVHCDLIIREQYYIDTLKPFFNIRKIADSNKGLKRTIEQKKYMVEQRKLKSGYLKGYTQKKESIEKTKETRLKNGGYKLSELTKQKISIANKGKKRTEEQKLKISDKLKGKKFSNETKLKLSEQKKGVKNHMFNKKNELHHNFGKKWKCKPREKYKKVIDINTGIIYDSLNIASLKLNINKKTLVKYILGYNKKINNFKYYE